MIRFLTLICVALVLAGPALLAPLAAPPRSGAAPAVAPYPSFNERVNVTVPAPPVLGVCCTTDGQRAGLIVRVYLPGNETAPDAAVKAWRWDGTPEVYDHIQPCELAAPPCWWPAQP